MIIKPKELCGLYYSCHSLDPAQAIERILETRGVSEDNLTAKGVKLMRELIAKDHKK